jgi:Ni,Fe-hydrogenase III component G
LTAQSYIDELMTAFAGAATNASAQSERRGFIEVDRSKLTAVVAYMKDRWGVTHLSTITALDLGDKVAASYHFWVQGATGAAGGAEITITAAAPKDDPTLPTLTGLIPGAIYYEREIHDLMGIVTVGHPDLRPLVLPEDWPAGVHPLRKDWTHKRTWTDDSAIPESPEQEAKAGETK